MVVATGAWPRHLGIRGEEHLTRSDQFLELDELPGRILFVGGGYIAFESSHIAARAGAQVTVLDRGELHWSTSTQTWSPGSSSERGRWASTCARAQR